MTSYINNYKKSAPDFLRQHTLSQKVGNVNRSKTSERTRKQENKMKSNCN